MSASKSLSVALILAGLFVSGCIDPAYPTARSDPNFGGSVCVFPPDPVESDIVERIVHIGGEVKAPGARPLSDGLTLLGLIQVANGLTANADVSKITITATNGSERKISLSNIASGKEIDPSLQQYDRITVPPKRKPASIR